MSWLVAVTEVTESLSVGSFLVVFMYVESYYFM